MRRHFTSLTRIALAALAALAVSVVTAAPAAAQEGADETIRVEAVEGTVEIRILDGDWQPCTPGQTFGAGTEISTGFKSAVRLVWNEHTTVDIGPLTQLLLSDLQTMDETAVTRLALKIGRVDFDVDTDKVDKADFRVVTPNVTVAVTGTDGFAENQNERFLAGCKTSGQVRILPQDVMIAAMDMEKRGMPSPTGAMIKTPMRGKMRGKMEMARYLEALYVNSMFVASQRLSGGHGMGINLGPGDITDGRHLAINFLRGQMLLPGLLLGMNSGDRLAHRHFGYQGYFGGDRPGHGSPYFRMLSNGAKDEERNPCPYKNPSYIQMFCD